MIYDLACLTPIGPFEEKTDEENEARTCPIPAKGNLYPTGSDHHAQLDTAAKPGAASG
jgi:hypothetical protein